MEDDAFLVDDDYQALSESFLFVPMVKNTTNKDKINGVAPITILQKNNQQGKVGKTSCEPA